MSECSAGSSEKWLNYLRNTQPTQLVVICSHVMHRLHGVRFGPRPTVYHIFCFSSATFNSAEFWVDHSNRLNWSKLICRLKTFTHIFCLRLNSRDKFSARHVGLYHIHSSECRGMMTVFWASDKEVDLSGSFHQHGFSRPSSTDSLGGQYRWFTSPRKTQKTMDGRHRRVEWL